MKMTDSLVMQDGRMVLNIGGADAQGFLQGLVTADVEKLTDGEATHAGLLSPQGKILFDFFIVRTGDGYLIDHSKAQSEAPRARLAMYKLRASVTIEPDGNLAVATAMAEQQPVIKGANVYRDPRLDAIGWRVIAKREELQARAKGQLDSWHKKRVALGLADTDSDIGSGELFPHEANFDQLGAVSFSKGCYVGQEVVSRMQHRGTARARIVPVELNGNSCQSGNEIRAGGKKIGHLLSVIKDAGLALVRLDRAGQALDNGDKLMAGDCAVKLKQPDWASFKVPGS